MTGRTGRSFAIEKVDQGEDLEEGSDGIPCASDREVICVTETSIAA